MPHPPGPYGRLARLAMGNRATVGLVLAVLVLLSAAIGLPPAVDANLLTQLPDREPTVAALRRLHDAEGGVSLVTLAFEADEPATLGDWLDGTTEALGRLDGVAWAIHEVEPDLARELGLLQLAPADVVELNHRLRGALALGPALNPFVTQRLMQMGPLTERIRALSETPGLLQGAEGTGRILVRPTTSAHDQAFAVALMDGIEGVLAERARAGVRTTWIGGAYRHNVEDFKGIKSDLFWTSFTSLVLVLSVVILAFRSWRATVLVFVPLIAANLVVLGLVRVVLGSLNTYTSFGTAILIGLGIDFAVHLIGRYREYRGRGFDLEESVQRAWDRTGPPCMTAALTSAAGFLALAAADFQGFAQLGLLLAMGLMVCLGAMLVTLPLLIPVLDADPPPLLGSPAGEIRTSRSTYWMAPPLLMVAVLVTGVVAVRTVPHLEWEFDFSALRRDGLAYAELSESERALAQDSYTPMIADLPDAAALSDAQARVEAAMADGDLPHVARALSVQTVLPPDQDARLDALSELVRLLEHENLRYLPPPLVKELLPLKGAELRHLDVADLPVAVQDLLGAGDGRHRLMLVPRGNMWDLREAAALEAEVGGVLPPGTVAGDYLAMGALYRVIQRDMPLVAGLAVFMVLALTAIDLRRLHWVVAAMGTLAAGMAWAAFAIDLVGVKLSIMNVVGVPILVGIGVDVVIHLLHRLRDEGPGGVRRALRTTGVAVSISTLTTIASFASLTVAGNRGVRDMGLLVVFGLAAVALASCVLLPLAWAAGWRVTGRAPGIRTPTPAPARRADRRDRPNPIE